MQIRLDDKGTVDVAVKKMQDRIKRLNSLQPALAAPAAALDKLMDDSFLRQRAPDGTPWEPLANVTIERRKAKRGGAIVKPLVDTGRYRASHHARARRSSIVFGSNTKYQHQLPTANRPARKTMPVRGDKPPWRLMTRGPAGRWLAQLRKSLLRYIETGRVR